MNYDWNKVEPLCREEKPTTGLDPWSHRPQTTSLSSQPKLSSAAIYNIPDTETDSRVEQRRETGILLQRKNFYEIRNIYFNKFNSVISDFKELNDLSTLKILLGEGDRRHVAVQYFCAWQELYLVISDNS